MATPQAHAFTSFPRYRRSRRLSIKSFFQAFGALKLQPQTNNLQRTETGTDSATSTMQSEQSMGGYRDLRSWLWPFGRSTRDATEQCDAAQATTRADPASEARSSSSYEDPTVTRQRERKASLSRRKVVKNTPAATTQPSAADQEARAETDELIEQLDEIVFLPEERKIVRRMEQTWRSRSGLARLQDAAVDKPAQSPAPNAMVTTGSGDPSTSESYSRYDWCLTEEQRVVLAGSAEREAQRRALPDHGDGLYLRGGGDGDESSGGRRRRTTLSAPESKKAKADDERVGPTLWFLAGGRLSRTGKLPTVGELRTRQEVEAVNQSKVGFLGTLLGRRKTGKVGILSTTEEAAEEGGEEV